MQTQKDLCLAHPRGGIRNIDVLSFGRLAWRVFAEVGKDQRVILDDEGKNLVLRRVAGMYEERLQILRGSLKKQGYISEVKSVISEFTQYGISPDDLKSFVETLSPDSYLCRKLQDLHLLYEGFEDYLAEKYITKEEMLDVLCRAVPESELLRGSVVAMDGFTGFTPVQNHLIQELLKVCEKVFVTVEMDEREDPYVYNHPYQLFALSKKMTSTLCEVAKRAGVEFNQPVCLYGQTSPRFQDSPELAFLEKNLFRGGERPLFCGEERISLHECRNPRGEARYVAESIRKLVREKGYRYREIAVITADREAYADALERECKSFQIPIFMDQKKSILLNSCVEYLRSLLAMEEQNFTAESVFRHLRTGLWDFSMDEIDRLENYCLALGIRGYRSWQRAWTRQTKWVGEEELEELNHLRVIFVEKLSALTMVLKQRKKTVRDVTLAVHEHIFSEHLQEKIAGMEKRFQDEGQLALAREYAQIYRITMELFDQFVALLGEEEITLKEYCELLDAGLEEAKVGVIPPAIDQVVVGDLERTRIKNIKALFFVGGNDTFLSGNAVPGGLLSERDREQFEQNQMELSPGTKERLYIQKFYLYLNLTKPSSFLSVSWSRVSGEGKTIRPSYLVQELCRLFPDKEIIDEEKRTACFRERTPETAAYELAQGLSARIQGIDAEWKELYTWFVRQEKCQDAIEKIRAAAFFRGDETKLGTSMAKEIYPPMEKVSVTRLERFASCAYAHFLTYGLRLSERETYQFEGMDLGNVMHQALERFSVKAADQKLDWVSISPEKREALVEESLEEIVQDYGNAILFSSARSKARIDRIRRVLNRTVWALAKQLEKGDFRPTGYEVQFGRGKIDRIDTCQTKDEVYVKVTDYKTGSNKKFDLILLYHGLQLQLPIYLKAAVELEARKNPEKEAVPAGIFYYRIDDPFVLREEREKNGEDSILKELRLDGMINNYKDCVRCLEGDLGGESVRYPMGRTKDGTLSGRSHCLEPELFQRMLEYASRKEQELKQEMYEGTVQASPYELDGATGCDFCSYREICRFDPRLEGYQYRSLAKYSQEEVFRMMESEEKKDGCEVDRRTEESD